MHCVMGCGVLCVVCFAVWCCACVRVCVCAFSCSVLLFIMVSGCVSGGVAMWLVCCLVSVEMMTNGDGVWLRMLFAVCT